MRRYALTGAVPGLVALSLALFAHTGCALRSEVTITPLVIKPTDTIRAANRVEDLVEVGDYPISVVCSAPAPSLRMEDAT